MREYIVAYNFKNARGQAGLGYVEWTASHGLRDQAEHAGFDSITRYVVNLIEQKAEDFAPGSIVPINIQRLDEL